MLRHKTRAAAPPSWGMVQGDDEDENLVDEEGDESRGPRESSGWPAEAWTSRLGPQPPRAREASWGPGKASWGGLRQS